MAFGVGDELSVKVSAKTADFRAGMESSKRSLSSVRSAATRAAGALQVFQGRADEAGDEAQTAGAKAGASSGGFLSLSSSSTATSGSFSALAMVTTATLIPSLLALSTIMAPLLAAMAGFVTVAGSILGVGLIGFLGAATARSDRLNSTFQKLKATLQTELAPVFDVFAGVLERLMKEFTAIVPELVPARKVIKDIAGQFEQLGMAMVNALPAFTELAVTLTQRFLPPFVRWAEGVLPKVPGMLQSLIPIMLQVGKTLQPLVQSFIRLAPAMMQFGMRVLNIVIPSMTRLVNIGGRVMQAINGMEQSMGKLTTRLIILGPLIAGVATTIGGISAPLLAAVAAVGALGYAFKTNFMGIRDTVTSVAQSIQKFVASLRIGQLVRSTGIIDNLHGAFQDLAAVGKAVVEGIQPAIKRVASTIKDNGPAIRAFFREIIESANGVVTVFRKTLLPALRFVLENYTIPLINRLSKIFSRNFGDILREVTETIDAIQGYIVGFIEFLMPIWNKWGDEIKTVAKIAFDAIITSVEIALEVISGVIQTILNLAQGEWGEAWDTIKSTVKTVIEAVKDFIDRWDMVQTIKDIINSMVSWLEETGTSLIEDAIDVVVEGVKSGFSYLTGTGEDSLLGDVKSALGSVADWLKNSWNIASDIADVFTDMGESVADAFADAWNSAIGGDSITIPEATLSIPDWVPEVGGQTATIGGDSLDIPKLNTGGFIEEEGIYQGHAGERVLNPAETKRLEELEAGGGAQEVDVSVNFDVPGDGPMAEFVREHAELTIEQRERRTQRNSGRNLNPR